LEKTKLLGSASVVVGHPFDTIKTRMQTAAVHTGLLQTIREFGGVTSLFRGLSAPLYAASAINGTALSLFVASMRSFCDDHNVDVDALNLLLIWATTRGTQSANQLTVSFCSTMLYVFSALVFGSYGLSSRLYDVYVFPPADYYTSTTAMARAEAEPVDNVASTTHDPWQKAWLCGSFSGGVQCIILCPIGAYGDNTILSFFLLLLHSLLRTYQVPFADAKEYRSTTIHWERANGSEDLCRTWPPTLVSRLLGHVLARGAGQS
jgi:hypothetical protein